MGRGLGSRHALYLLRTKRRTEKHGIQLPQKQNGAIHISSELFTLSELHLFLGPKGLDANAALFDKNRLNLRGSGARGPWVLHEGSSGGLESCATWGRVPQANLR